MKSEKAVFETTCPSCMSKLTFGQEDINVNVNPRYVVCPDCGTHVYVFDKEKGFLDTINITYESDKVAEVPTSVPTASDDNILVEG